jgi:hypothetical protein
LVRSYVLVDSGLAPFQVLFADEGLAIDGFDFNARVMSDRRRNADVRWGFAGRPKFGCFGCLGTRTCRGFGGKGLTFRVGYVRRFVAAHGGRTESESVLGINL